MTQHRIYRRYTLLVAITALFVASPALLLTLRAFTSSTAAVGPAMSDTIFRAEEVYAGSGSNRLYEARLTEILNSEPITTYIPIVITGSQTVITAPVITKAISAWGYDFQEAYNGGNFWGHTTSGIGVGITPFESAAYYFIRRTFITWSVPELPDGYTLTSVSLIMSSCGRALGGMPFGAVQLNLGTWTGSLADDAGLWPAFDPGQTVGEFIEARDCPPELREVSLDPAYFMPGQTIRLVIRDAEDHLDFRPDYPLLEAERGMFTSVLSPLYWQITLEGPEQE
jgi:hypothetical protein